MKIALLDDWQNNALTFAEFERLKPEHQLDVFTDTVDGAVLVERLQPYDIILAMRERTGLQIDILSQLPHLQAVITCGMRNAAIDLNYCKAKSKVFSFKNSSPKVRAGIFELLWSVTK